MILRSTVALVALLLFAGEGICTTLCAPETTAGAAAHGSPAPPCHEPPAEPSAPPAEHDCSGPCDATLASTGPELPTPAHAPGAAPALCLGAGSTSLLRAIRPTAPERLPPPPRRFLLHAAFLI